MTPATVAAILHDHQASIEGVFDFVAGKRPLTCGYVKELHALLTRNQATARGRDPTGRETEIPLRRGEWKSFPNNPTRPDGTTHVYCPPEQVQGEMERLLSRHAQHADDHRVPPETQAAWLHHRFTQIHPFQDGNGRAARTLASLVFIRAGWFPLSIHRDQKVEYVDALEAADRGDLAPLIRLFARIARDALIRAMTVADQSERDLGGLEQLVAAARDRLIVRGAEVNGQALDRARSIAETLNEASAHELERTRAVLQEGIASELPDLAITVDSAPFGDSKRTNWYRATQVRFARGELYYFANVDAYTSYELGAASA